MTDFKGLVVNMIVAGLFVLALMAYAITLQTDNQSEENLTDNPIVNNSYYNLQSSLNNIESNASTQRILLEKENPTLAVGSLILTSILSAGKVFNSVLITIFNVLIIIPAQVIGISPIVYGVIGGLFLMVAILALWYLWKLGG